MVDANPTEEEAQALEVAAIVKLRRFCYVGSLDPVFMSKRKNSVVIDVKRYWPLLGDICKVVKDESFLAIVQVVLLEERHLVRRDESLFVLAVYLMCDTKIQWKTAVRKMFPLHIRTDNDLFLFCKYASEIQKVCSRRGYPRTIHKAVVAWYKTQTPEDMLAMWMERRGNYGLTHRFLITHMRINDSVLAMTGMVRPLFDSCTQLLKAAEVEMVEAPPALSNHVDGDGDTVGDAPAPKRACINDRSERSTSDAGEKSEMPSSIVLGVSKLRTTKDNKEALLIIRKFKLSYGQVPRHLLRSAPIMEALIPTMTYLELLHCWPILGKCAHFDNQRIWKLCQKTFEDKAMLRRANIHPVLFLLLMYKFGIRDDLQGITYQRVESMKMPYYRQLYVNSFGQSPETGMRMHITINLQDNYKKKMLRSQHKLSYFNAAIAFAFGYFRQEKRVDVFHWVEANAKLSHIAWKNDMDIKAATDVCEKISNKKNQQRLFAPILNAISRRQVYDVFLVIVPSAGRGNPNQKAEFLAKFVDKYRATKNKDAKYIILNLLKFRKSLRYSQERSEHILEICGLDENTPKIIYNYVRDKFD